IAREQGRPIVTIDGRDVPATPEGLLASLGSVDLADSVARLNETRPLLLIDTFEELLGLGRFLQDDFLARLDTDVKVVIAGRHPLGVVWSTDSVWQKAVRGLPLAGFSAQESRAYLERRGVKAPLVEQVLNAAGGNPLALSLATDMVSQIGVRELGAAPEW